jgi:hypothetical protein
VPPRRVRWRGGVREHGVAPGAINGWACSIEALSSSERTLRSRAHTPLVAFGAVGAWLCVCVCVCTVESSRVDTGGSVHSVLLECRGTDREGALASELRFIRYVWSGTRVPLAPACALMEAGALLASLSQSPNH